MKYEIASSGMEPAC